ncbi:MAG: hypothetical protein ACE147_00605 [Candidatus Methylomirabilales bacterium]
MSDLRPDVAIPFAAFGVPATVTVPGAEPVETSAIWLAPVAYEVPGVLRSTNEPLYTLALMRSAVPRVPRGTLVACPERAGGEVLTWTVEAILGKTADEIRVIVIPTEAD